MDENTGRDFFIGLLVGTAVGLAVGLLYAPRPGKETRSILKEKVEDWKDKASELVDKVKEKAAGTEA
jgi:gas vesicle protein